MLPACSTFKQSSKVEIAPNLLVECLPVEALQSPSRADVMRNITTNAVNQQACIDAHKALIEAVKKGDGIK